MSILRQPPRAGIGRENQDAQSMLCPKHSHGMPCSSSRWAARRHPHNSFWQRSWCQEIFPVLVSRILYKPLCCFPAGIWQWLQDSHTECWGATGRCPRGYWGTRALLGHCHHFLTPGWAPYSFLGMAGPMSSEDTCLPAVRGELEELGD